MHAASRRYHIRIYLVIAIVSLATGAALLFGFFYRPDNEDLSRAGSFAGVIGTTLGVLVAAYAIFIEYQRAELRHDEANAAWAAAIRLRYAMASVDWLLPDAGQNAWIVASSCRPRRPRTAWVVRELGSAGLPGSKGDTYLTGLEELHDAISGAVAAGVGRVLGVAWNSEMWPSPDRPDEDEDDARGVLAVRPLLELKSSVEMLIEQRRRGLMALPDAVTLVQLQAIFRALSNSQGEDVSWSEPKSRHVRAPNLTLMHEFRHAYEDPRFEALSSDTFFAFYVEEHGAWMGSLLPYMGLALPYPGKDQNDAAWMPVGVSDRATPETARPSISPFFTWRPERPFMPPAQQTSNNQETPNLAVELTPDTWDAAALAARLQLASNAGNAEATNALGVLYACTKPQNYAYAPLELAVNQGSINATANLGIMHYENAVQMEQRHGRDAPDVVQAWNNAAGLFIQVLEEDSDHPQASLFGGLLAYQANQPDDAEAYFRRAFDRGILAAAGALITLAASRGDGVQAVEWRDKQAAFLDAYRTDDPLEVLATLNGYSLDLTRALQ